MTIGYKSGDPDSNATLRSALAQVSGLRCYACTEPKKFADLQIDHLIPRSRKGTTAFLIPPGPLSADEYDVDDVENLAVICGQCNRMKSDKEFRQSLAFEMHRMNAVRRADNVRSIVQGIRSGHELVKCLVSATQFDLANPDSVRLYIELAPAAVQRLAILDEEKVDYVVAELAPRTNGGLPIDTRLLLNNRMRFIRDTIDTLWSTSLAHVAQEASRALTSHLGEQAQDAIRNFDVPAAQLAVQTPDALNLEFTYSGGEIRREGDVMVISLAGEADGMFTAHVAGYDNRTATGHRDSMTDVWIFGAFRVEFAHPLIQPMHPVDIGFDVDTAEVGCEIDWSS